ncbi:3-hydroxyacyl-CoA dehydrogenase [Aspergillus heteromorphus CBS 117.55]|uniref:3-hydroxyacyl-CoA dehydrogenase n=1 Tax=Aspergillus heteromorphus CBS 117.55 TaxID=1448321 RepID=A0A317WPA6_9EURO|nr:3-hydroxyacyl-CoA dehydrogenase [Aspergillus heteromorphus CBS 117.55]PWY86120.1 3-hydroxyacyl-CoA dehydrogenase [Aspergillus heteromorphus CBS 117.55]
MTRLANAVTLLGAGTQGSRLAYMWSRLGKPVYLVDKSSSQLTQASSAVHDMRERNPPEREGKLIRLDTDNMEKALRNSWLTIECIPEDLQRKRAVIKELDTRTDPETIIATNSSSYPISDIVKGLSLKADDRLVNLHAFWPPETQALEIMGTEKTRPDIIPLLMKETQRHGFMPFHVKKHSTGYMFNRIWAAIKRETLLVLEEGIATPKEVDQICKAVLKTPLGPCEQMDIAGLDVILDIEKHYAQERSGIPEGPRRLLKEMVGQGNLGVKSGSGFFKYNNSVKT